MAAEASGSLEELLSSLEAALGRMAAGTAQLDQLVSAHEEAGRLLAAADARFQDLSAWASRMEAEA